jgi:hypothetical protein
MKFKIDGFGFFHNSDTGETGPDLSDQATHAAIIERHPAMVYILHNYDKFKKIADSIYIYLEYGIDHWMTTKHYKGKRSLKKLAEVLPAAERRKVEKFIECGIYDYDVPPKIEGIQKAPDRVGYIYIMERPGTGLYKIGRSTDPQGRQNEIRRQKQDRTIKIINKFPADDYVEAEYQLHKMFWGRKANKKRTDEWFKLRPKDVKRLCKVQSYQDREFLYHH